MLKELSKKDIVLKEIENGMHPSEIAKKYGYSQQLVYTYIKRSGYDTKFGLSEEGKRKRLELNKKLKTRLGKRLIKGIVVNENEYNEKLLSLLIKDYSIIQISNEFNVHPATIRNNIKSIFPDIYKEKFAKNSGPKNGASENFKRPSNKLKLRGVFVDENIVKKKLYDFAIIQDLTLEEMSSIFECDMRTITNWLKKFNMQRGSRKGERALHWTGNNKKYRGGEWKDIRLEVIDRDNYTCQECGIKQEDCDKTKNYLQVHHIVSYEDTEDNSLDNLITLCTNCHLREEHRRWVESQK